jgi:type VI secretion system protein ImpC
MSSINSDQRFCILICGDFSGRASRGIRSPLAGRTPILVDRDNLDEVVRHTGAALNIPGFPLTFTEMEDFHPDRIFERADRFQALIATMRNYQSKPASAAAASVPHRNPSPPPHNLLDQILDDHAEPEFTGDLSDFIRKAMTGQVAPREDPKARDYAAEGDRLASIVMNSILHHPDFQALEAAWRGVEMLLRRLDTDGDLRLYLLDATKDEIASDPDGFRRVFARGDRPWAVAAALYTFGQSEADAKVLAQLGAIGSQAGAPILAEADPPSEPHEAWAILRRSPEARWIGLALPRFLLRLPYGKRTSPVESFDFDEMPESEHSQYLWGSPAIACMYLLGLSFQDDGWDLRPGTQRRIEGLPLHTYRDSSGIEIKPCAEFLMTEKDAEFLMEAGIMPLATLKEQDTALLVRFQSIAEPLAPLSGRWVN